MPCKLQHCLSLAIPPGRRQLIASHPFAPAHPDASPYQGPADHNTGEETARYEWGGGGGGGKKKNTHEAKETG